MNRTKPTALAAALLLAAAPASADWLQITIENVAPSDGVSFSPVWVGFHDGSFDLFNSGEAASTAIENVAELGDSGQLDADFKMAFPDNYSTVIMAENGFNNLIYTPGTTQTRLVEVDPVNERYMSFGAMVVPSNDWFAGNEDPTAVMLFDEEGMFVGGQTWTISGDAVWESGTELNSAEASGGGAFIVDSDAMMGTSESMMISSPAGSSGNLYVGVDQPSGTMLGTGLSGDIIEITVAMAEAPTWGGYEVDVNGWVQTPWFGWVNVNHAPWLYNGEIHSWQWAEEPEMDAEGLWTWVFRMEPVDGQ